MSISKFMNLCIRDWDLWNHSKDSFRFMNLNQIYPTLVTVVPVLSDFFDPFLSILIFSICSFLFSSVPNTPMCYDRSDTYNHLDQGPPNCSARGPHCFKNNYVEGHLTLPLNDEWTFKSRFYDKILTILIQFRVTKAWFLSRVRRYTNKTHPIICIWGHPGWTVVGWWWMR